MQRYVRFVLVFGVLHWIAATAAVVAAFSAGMDRFDRGTATMRIGEALVSAAASALTFPVMQLSPRLPGSGPIDHLWFLLNGLLWGAVAALVHNLWRRIRGIRDVAT